MLMTIMDMVAKISCRLRSTNKITSQEPTSIEPSFNPDVTPIWGFMWFTFALFLFSLLWAGYVLHRLHTYGAIENWSLPPEERKARREMERKKVVGVRRLWIVVMGLLAKKDQEKGKGKGKGMEVKVDEGVRLERMHTVRRM